jgi:transcriptional antiterminator RfaH
MIALHKNPPIAHPAGSSVSDVRGRWWVAHTRSRHEKALAFDLLGWGIPYFLPMVERTVCIQHRRFRGMYPLFSGYVFLAGNEDARYQAMTTSHVASLITVVDQTRLVGELCQIQRALATPAGFDPFPFLREGSHCRIKAGPLRGVQGVVVHRGGVTRLVLQVEMLGQAVATEVDPSLVEVVE